MKLYVERNITQNQFILQIKRKYLNDLENLDVDDIWLYQLNKKKQMTTVAKSFDKIFRFVNIGQNKKRLNSTMSTCGIIY